MTVRLVFVVRALAIGLYPNCSMEYGTRLRVFEATRTWAVGDHGDNYGCVYVSVASDIIAGSFAWRVVAVWHRPSSFQNGGRAENVAAVGMRNKSCDVA